MLSKIPGVNRLFTNRGIGRDVGAMNMTVTPRIIILEEEELRQTGFSYDTVSQMGGSGTGSFSASHGGALGETSDGLGAVEAEVAQRAAFLTQHVARTPREVSPPVGVDPRLPSLAEIRRQNEQRAVQRSAEAQNYWVQGRRAEAEGKKGVARIYYQMALRRADPALAEQIMANLASLDSPSELAQFSDR